MNLTKTQVEKTTVQLTVELLDEEMKPYIDKAVQRISKEVKVDGFRPGKVPYDVLAKKVGEMEIYQEASRDAIDGTLPTAVKREEIDFIGRPEINVDKIVPGQGVTYSATFAMLPSVTLNDYKSVRVKKEAAKLDEEKAEKTLNDLRKLHVKVNVVERAAKQGDQLKVDFSITLDGVPFEGGQGKDVPVTIGENQFIPGFEEQLVDMKATDNKKFKLTFPAEYGAAHLAGKECDFDVTVHSVGEVELPELNDEFAKLIGFESADALRTQIRDNIQKEIESEADQKYEIAVIDAILEQAEFDPIPELMITNEREQMMQELQQHVEDQGGKFTEYLEHIKKTPEELMESWKDQAEKRIKAALAMKLIGEQEKVEVPETELDAEVNRFQEMYKDVPEQQAQFSSLEFRAYTRSILRNRKIVELLKESASQ